MLTRGQKHGCNLSYDTSSVPVCFVRASYSSTKSGHDVCLIPLGDVRSLSVKDVRRRGLRRISIYT